MTVTAIQEKARPVLEHYQATEAYVFGSAARGEDSPNDIDILVKFKELKGLFEHIQAKCDLEDALGRPVDLVAMEALRDEMKQSVDRDKVRIF